MRTIGVVTVGRSDYGIYYPLLKTIQQEPALKLHLYVSGAHLSSQFGFTIHQIRDDGFKIHEAIEILLASDSPEAICKSIGLGVIGFAETFRKHHPDILVVLGDRFEMYASVVAALPFNIPVAHIHGGELTQGAIDDAIRHSITKLSHLHFVSTQDYARRVIQMGEEPWRVVVSGALSLDNLQQTRLLDRREFAIRYNLVLPRNFLLVTYHPVTLEYQEAGSQIYELIAALKMVGIPVLFTMPNADTGGQIIRQAISQAISGNPMWFAVENLGIQGYFSVMNMASAMVGNSSSGIIEAASFRLPVVNIGNRQKGRIQTLNIIDSNYDRASIGQCIRKAISPEFHESLLELKNPYGDGSASHKIIDVLKNIHLGTTLISKTFYDV